MAQPPLPAGARLGVDVRCGLLIKEGKTMRPDERKGLLRVLRVRSSLLLLPPSESDSDRHAIRRHLTPMGRALRALGSKQQPRRVGGDASTRS